MYQAKLVYWCARFDLIEILKFVDDVFMPRVLNYVLRINDCNTVIEAKNYTVMISHFELKYFSKLISILYFISVH